MNNINQQKHHPELNSKVGKLLHLNLSFQLYHDLHLGSLELAAPVGQNI